MISKRTPTVIVFDVNETLSNTLPLAERFVEVGAAASLAAGGGNAQFSTIGTHLARELLGDVTLNRSLDQAVDHIMAAFATMNVHPDIAGGIHALKRLGLRLITLSNGSASIARTLLAREELDGQFEAMLSVDDAPAWKPARSAYDHAVNFCGVPPADMLLVAVHPWDIHGAARAGLQTGWLNRDDAVYPDYFEVPHHTFRTLSDLAAEIAIDTGPIPHL